MMLPGKRRRSLRGGFTLVEVLVALAIMGVVLAGLFSLISGTLRFTSLSRAVSVSLEDVADAEGYLNDTLRYARQVYERLTVQIDGDNFECRISSGRCVAVTVPVVDDTNAANIIDFDLVVLLVDEIGDLYEADGLRRGWAGRETLALIEYRILGICGSMSVTACAGSLGPDSLPTTVVTEEPGVLLTGLDDRNGEVDFIAEISPALLELTLSARAGAGRTETLLLRRSSVSLQVLVREVFDPDEPED